MKTFTITIVAALLAGSVAFGQTIPVSGTVADEKGQPIPYAFVRDAQHNYATYADSTGFFKLRADPASSLQVMANDYKSATVKVDVTGGANIISLKPINPPGTPVDGIVPLKSNEQTKVAGSTFLQERQLLAVWSPVYAGGPKAGGGGGTNVTIVKQGYTVEPTRGSRYLYDNWVPGFGINTKDSIVVETANLYNYDKMNGNIMYTNDGRSMAAVSTQQVKTFTLYDKSGGAHVYENAPMVSNKPFTEILLKTPKYRIYKKVDTKLQRADFHTDGVIENGHRYDEYIDDERYYFVGANDNKAQSISLKKSTLKKLLAGDADSFISAQGSRDVDEDYVRDLGKSLGK
ncbi:MAG: carboxypeptidase-like regulatory domain-containing protein [Bacteroidota bacterium]|nr:carboxypeptidase-like regulatory domain-containing protein [Bacteroidota bacterium]